MMKKNVLVTGCGGDIGMALGRILKQSYPHFRIIGADITADCPGKFVFDAVHILPRADADNYFEAVNSLIIRESVDLIVPMSEPELRGFFKHGYTESLERIPVVMANSRAFEFSFDKLKTAELLSSLHLPHPWTRRVVDDPVSLPCIVKNRGLTGKGGVEVVSADSVDYFRRTRPDDLWQEFLPGDEYTCGLYRSQAGGIRSIIFKRTLSNGTSGFTSSGETIQDPQIEAFLESLALGLSLKGSCNIQMRLSERGPMVFEINPRFSSTVMFRHKLGFKDLVWSCEESLGMPLSDYQVPRTGIRFYKGYSEYIDW